MTSSEGEQLKRPAPAPPDEAVAKDARDEAYLDGDPFVDEADEVSAIADARKSAPSILTALREKLADGAGELKHCYYPCGSVAIVTANDEHLGLALDSSPAAVTEFVVHRDFADKFDVVFFGGQPRTTLVSFAAAPSRSDIAVGLRGRALLQRDVEWCEEDLHLEPTEVAWTRDGKDEDDEDEDADEQREEADSLRQFLRQHGTSWES